MKYGLACGWKWEDEDEEAGGAKQKHRYTSLRYYASDLVK